MTATLTAPVVLAPAGLPRDEWLAVRRRGIGSSDIPAIVGMSTFSSPLGLYFDKIGAAPDDEPSEAREWGVLLEDVVARYFAVRTGLDVQPSPGVLAHPDRLWQLANVDRLVDGVPLEVKTTSAYKAGLWPTDEDGRADFDTLPDPVALQVAHQLDVTSAPYAHVAVLIGGQTYRQFRVERDDALCEQVREIGDRFWHDHVVRRVPPPADGSGVTTALLSRLYDVRPESVTVLDPAEIDPLLAARALLAGQAKDIGERLDAVKNRIRLLLGEHEVGVVDDQPVVTWRQSPRAGYTVAPTTARTLRFPKAGRRG